MASGRDTVGQNQVVLRHPIIHYPTSSGVSTAERAGKVSGVERASELSGAEQANEQCERTDEQVPQYLRPGSWLF